MRTHEELVRWALDRMGEHIGTVTDLEEAGAKGDMFRLGSGLTQLRHMLNANCVYLHQALHESAK